ncbi:MAG: hypothetical protein KDH17_10015 [Rhodocyclaceae bacterium]|nr:hypothetical protein [Rhodocyclaceae bacterium]
MLWLDLAIADRRDAERAFFVTDDDSADDIVRVRIEDCSEFELAHLALLLTPGFDPQLVVDGDRPSEVVTSCDRRLVSALAATAAADLPALAERWHGACSFERAESVLPELHALACEAERRGRPLLYAQGDDRDCSWD